MQLPPLAAPASQVPELQPWMRPRDVAMSYHLPEPVLAEILAIGPPPPGHGREPLTMGGIAARLGVGLEYLTRRVRAGAALLHAGPGR